MSTSLIFIAAHKSKGVIIPKPSYCPQNRSEWWTIKWCGYIDATHWSQHSASGEIPVIGAINLPNDIRHNTNTCAITLSPEKLWPLPIAHKLPLCNKKRLQASDVGNLFYRDSVSGSQTYFWVHRSENWATEKLCNKFHCDPDDWQKYGVVIEFGDNVAYQFEWNATIYFLKPMTFVHPLEYSWWLNHHRKPYKTLHNFKQS